MHYFSVQNVSVKNITRSADEALINKARQKARMENSSLNHRFREWLQRHISPSSKGGYTQLMKSLGYVEPGGSFSRDEMNER